MHPGRGAAIVAGMFRHRLLIAALLVVGCDNSSAVDGGVDASADAGTDAGTDAGFVPTCPGRPTPAPWDPATAEPITMGDPIVADPMTWTWVPFPESRCVNGSPTGIGVNINPGSPNLMILLEGGGACFDLLSCAGAANTDGYDETKFSSDARGLLQRGILSRGDAENPVADWSFVYVPYCSGDVHAGTNEVGFGGRTFVGYRNFTAFLSRIVPTFPSAELVLLTGRSAGGLGSVVNYPQTANAFGSIPVHAFNDAGAILSDQYMDPCLQTTVREVWGLDAVIPTDCELCSCSDGGGLANVYPYAAARYPDRRFGLATSMEDLTIRTFYGYGYSPACNFPQNMPGEDFAAGLDQVRDMMSGVDNFHTFFVAGEDHTFTYQSLSNASVDGVTLATWLGDLVAGSLAWTDVGP